jgi:hypothetical protein
VYEYVAILASDFLGKRLVRSQSKSARTLNICFCVVDMIVYCGLQRLTYSTKTKV